MIGSIEYYQKEIARLKSEVEQAGPDERLKSYMRGRLDQVIRDQKEMILQIRRTPSI